MPGELELDANQIVAAAVEIMRESGLDAISMRSVAGRLGYLIEGTRGDGVACEVGTVRACTMQRWPSH